MLRILVLFAGLGFSAGALAWNVGEAMSDGSTYLYTEPVEGVYTNNWSGTKLYYDKVENKATVTITGEGKTVVGFTGSAVLNCAEKTASWVNSTATGFSGDKENVKAEDVVPDEVVANAVTLLCK